MAKVVIDKTKVYVPKGFNYTRLEVIKYWNQFKVVSPHGEILLKDSRPYMHKNRMIPWKSIIKSWLSKPRVVDYSRHAAYLPMRIANYIQVSNSDIRKERLNWLVALLTNHEMTEINEKFYELVDNQPMTLKNPENHPYDIDWAKYDQLQPSANRAGEMR